MEDDDDEFGDLYTDVLKPFASIQAPPPPPPPPAEQKPKEQPSVSQQPSSSAVEPSRRPIGINFKISDQERITSSAPTNRILAPASVQGADEVGLARVAELSKSSFQDSKQSSISPFKESKVVDIDSDVKFDIEEADAGPADDDPLITGVSNSRQSNGGDDWDSDSEDELQIVLNENPPPIGMFGDEDDDDEGEPLVIVGDEALNQTVEGTEWREHGGESGQDGERKESGGVEALKTSGAIAVAPKVGYGSHGYHPFHSQFKYVRPGAAPIPGPGGASIQNHPPTNMGPMIGRGRGEWRPAGRGGPPFQKGYHGGPAWGSGRGFGGGLDFTLPSHKTIFEVDIDSFEEKPWKHPGIDMTDFFNFGLNEESWKDYTKQLDQHRLENTMQNRIRVHEGVRTEQAFDPDMPPELAAAAGVQNVPAETSNVGKPDSIQTDSRAAPRPPVTIGRPIQVEAGSGERLPSTETRQQRIREPDSVIEIDCGAFFEDNSSKKQEIPDVGSPADDMDGDRKSEKESIHQNNNNDDTSPEIYRELSLEDKKSESMEEKSADHESSLEHKVIESSIPTEVVNKDSDLDAGPVEDEEFQSESKEKQDLEDREDSRAGRSSENSKARSGSCKLHDGNEDEVTGGTHRDREYRRGHEKARETGRARPKVRAEDTRKRDRDRTDDEGPRHRNQGQESERPYGYQESMDRQKRERERDSSDEYYSTKNRDDILMHRNEKSKSRSVLSEPRDGSLRTEEKPRSNYRVKETSRHKEQPKHKERQEKLSSHGEHRSSTVSDKQKTRERDGSAAASSRRNQRDHTASGLASSDEEQSNSRRGRSKLERWTSHKEIDFTANIKSSKTNGRPKDYAKAVEPVPEDKDPETGSIPPENRHIDAVERLKKRSERFKLPLSDAVPSAKTEASAETESKHERPARKRRWVSS